MNALQQIAHRLGSIEQWIRDHQGFEASHSTCHIARLQSSQTITTATNTDLSFDVALYNPDTLWVVGSPTIMTTIVSGVYTITGSVLWSGMATDSYQRARITVNGSPIGGAAAGAVAGKVGMVNPSFQVRLSAGDTIGVEVRQESGGDETVTAAYLSATRIA